MFDLCSCARAFRAALSWSWAASRSSARRARCSNDRFSVARLRLSICSCRMIGLSSALLASSRASVAARSVAGVGREAAASISASSARCKPVQNVFIESFNSRLRDECLNEHVFLTLAEAREIIEAWRHDYNHVRPHSSLGGLTPSEFANRQGDGPLEQVLGSAARPPLRHRPNGGKTSTESTYERGEVGCRPSATVELRMLTDPGTHRLFRPEEIVNASTASRRRGGPIDHRELTNCFSASRRMPADSS